MKLTRDFYIPKDSQPITAPNSTAIVYTYTIEQPGRPPKLAAMGFGGKRSKPDWHHIFRDEAQRQQTIDNHFASCRSSEANKLDRAAKHTAERCHNTAQVYAKALSQAGTTHGAWLNTADVAVLIRERLAAEFPGTTFSVRADSYSGGSSIRVRWTDGPAHRDVSFVAKPYEFSSFDGTIDLKFHCSNWLAPDGSVTLAHTRGTTGSRGSIPEYVGSPHHPGAVEVTGGTDYVSVTRDISDTLWRQLAERIAKDWGIPVPDRTQTDIRLPDGRYFETHLRELSETHLHA